MEDIVRQANQLWFKTKEYCDDFTRPEAKQLNAFVRELYNDAKSDRNPGKLLYKLQTLERMIQNLKGNNGIYSPDHVDDMHDRCMDLEKELKKVS